MTKTKKKPNIIYMNMGIGVGGYSPYTGEITLHKGLKDFPMLHLMVLKHEMGHATKDKNILDCLIRDISDYPKMWLMEDSKHFKKKYQKPNPILNLQIVLYQLLIIFIVLPCTYIIVYSTKLYWKAEAFWKYKVLKKKDDRPVTFYLS